MLASARIFRYQLPFLRPAPFTSSLQGNEGFREGLIIELAYENGQIGYGEAAPLPGFHTQSFSVVFQQLVGFLSGQKDEIERKLVLMLQGGGPGGDLAPCAQIALEMAVWHATCLPILPLCEQIKVNGLIWDLTTQADPVSQALSWAQEGYKRLKIKVGRLSFKEEIKAIWDIRQRLSESVEISLDANRGFSLQAAIEFANALKESRILYIEEPLQKLHELPLFFAQTGMMSALDESLWLEKEQTLASLEREIYGFILKPSALGSLALCKRLIEKARAKNHQWVITSCFESALGHALLSLFAASEGEKEPINAGLGSVLWLDQGGASPPFSIQAGQVRVKDASAFLSGFFTARSSLQPSAAFSLIWQKHSWTK